MARMNDDLTAERLAEAVHEGRRTMPEARPLLVCNPEKIESWRVFKIMAEFVEGFDIIRRYGLAATTTDPQGIDTQYTKPR